MPVPQRGFAPLTGIPAFVIIWLGQLFSVVGTGLSAFALGVWIYQATGSVTSFALIMVLSSVPVVVLLPLAGALVDRWDRRRTMLVSNLVGTLSALALAVSVGTGEFWLWQVYLMVAVSGIAAAFHWPAYAASPTLLVPKPHLARAAGMMEVARASALVFAPLLAVILVTSIDIRGVLLVDAGTFLIAAASLTVVRLPSPATVDGPPRPASLLADVSQGLAYVRQRPGLSGLLLLFAAMNLFGSVIPVLIIPLLSFGSPSQLGVGVGVASSGLLIGGAIMSAWGGPPRRVLSIVVGGCAQGLCMIAAGMRASATLIVTSVFFFNLITPLINGCSQAIWQVKVPAGLQGRVFAMRRMLAQVTTPMGYLLAGPLADAVFEPMLTGSGPLAGHVGRVIGTGPGRGVGLFLVVLGVLYLATNVAALRSARLMRVEDELPDALIGVDQAMPADHAVLRRS